MKEDKQENQNNEGKKPEDNKNIINEEMKKSKDDKKIMPEQEQAKAYNPDNVLAKQTF